METSANEAAANIFDQIDKNEDGRLTEREFTAWAEQNQQAADEFLVVLDAQDFNELGDVSFKDRISVFWLKSVMEFDDNVDMKLDKAEFCQLYEHVAEQATVAAKVTDETNDPAPTSSGHAYEELKDAYAERVQKARLQAEKMATDALARKQVDAKDRLAAKQAELRAKMGIVKSKPKESTVRQSRLLQPGDNWTYTHHMEFRSNASPTVEHTTARVIPRASNSLTYAADPGRKELEAALARAHEQAAAAYSNLEQLMEDESAKSEAIKAAMAKKAGKGDKPTLYWSCGKCRSNYTEDESAIKCSGYSADQLFCTKCAEEIYTTSDSRHSRTVGVWSATLGQWMPMVNMDDTNLTPTNAALQA